MIGLITHNWRYKAGSVVLAGLLWLGLIEQSELATSVLTPIQYKNVPKDMELSSDVTDKVHLELRGPASKLRPAALADSSVLLDLRGVTQTGEHTFAINQDALVLPSGVRLDRAVPAQVRLRFERRMVKEVPVRSRVRHRPAEGYEVASEKIEPGNLRVVGPESRVARVVSVDTDSIDLDHLKDATEVFEVHAYLSDPQVRFDGDGRVNVRIEVRKTGSSPR